MAPPDPILRLSTEYKEDKDKRKVNLGIGAYRDEDGKPYVFPVVRKAEEFIMDQNLDKEYAPIEGDKDFAKGARGVIFGWEHPYAREGPTAARVVSA